MVRLIVTVTKKSPPTLAQHQTSQTGDAVRRDTETRNGKARARLVGKLKDPRALITEHRHPSGASVNDATPCETDFKQQNVPLEDVPLCIVVTVSMKSKQTEERSSERKRRR